MFLSKLGYSELVQRLFEKNDIFSCGPPLEMRTRMRSSRARTQNKTLTATCALESAAPIGRTDKSNYQLEDDGERGRDSGRKRQRQQQHGRAPAVNFASSSAAAAGGGGQRRRQAAMATVGSGSGTCGCGGSVGRRLVRWWRQAMEEKERAAAAEPSDFVSLLILPLRRRKAKTAQSFFVLEGGPDMHSNAEIPQQLTT